MSDLEACALLTNIIIRADVRVELRPVSVCFETTRTVQLGQAGGGYVLTELTV